MKAATSGMKEATPSGRNNMEMLGLALIGVYVTMMPKELSHLVFAVVGAGTYLLFLTMQPNLDLFGLNKGAPAKGAAPTAGPAPEPGADPAMAQTAIEATGPAKPSEAAEAAEAASGHGSRRPGRAPGGAKDARELPSTAAKACNGSPRQAQSAKGVCCPRFQNRDRGDGQAPDAIKNHANFARLKKRLTEHFADRRKGKALSADAPEWIQPAAAATSSLSAAAAPFVYSGGGQMVGAAPAMDPSMVPAWGQEAAGMDPSMMGAAPAMDMAQMVQPFYPVGNVMTMTALAIPTPMAMDIVQPKHPEELEGVCWDWVSTGYCKRGFRCRWEHPADLQSSMATLATQPTGIATQPALRPAEHLFTTPYYFPGDGGFPADPGY